MVHTSVFRWRVGSCETPHLPQRRHLLFYCSYTPQKVIWELYYIGGVFFGASSFGRFGRRGKTPKSQPRCLYLHPLRHSQSSGISRCQPCCTRAESSSLPSDAPAKLERQSGRKRVTPTMTRVFPSLSFATGWTIKDPVDMLTC